MGKILLRLSDRFFYLVLLVAIAGVAAAAVYKVSAQLETRGELVLPEETGRPPLVRGTVDRQFVGSVAPGQPATFEPDLISGVLPGIVYAIGNATDSGEAYEVWVALTDIPPHSQGWLTGSMRGNVLIRLPSRSLLDPFLNRRETSGRLPAEAPVPMPSWPLTVSGDSGKHRIVADIATTPQQLLSGLMFRDGLPENSGMLFVFPGSSIGTFWMKNVSIPLSVAFLDGSGAIIGILDMEPCAEEPCERYGIDAPYAMALEMNRGWFAARHVKVGDRVDTSHIPVVSDRR